ncbi:ComF family protein [Shewanella sp. NFH-SH190041]|uniref:ComF family protein n=1 Tax=Shewanella sp. NFH-SH190041 TaxID=2950245 RepID=UPI0021C2EFF3|nr:ComF family protein [Shewanella sp. NFH-SH190041]
MLPLTPAHLLRQLQQWMALSLPNRCLLCHQHIAGDEQGICPACLQGCSYRTPVCLGCGREMAQLLRYCGRCMPMAPLTVVAPGSYHQGLGHWVAAIKYQRQLAGLRPITGALVQRIEMLTEVGLISRPQVLLPVPLHPDRLKQRGFNQAYLIAELLSIRLAIPLDTTLLQRCRATQPQAGLDGKARRRNLHQAFCLTGAVPWQRVALVDDVVTTGTTVKEIAALLQPYGVQVQVWCLARAEAPG